jgi:hypothetical protein
MRVSLPTESPADVCLCSRAPHFHSLASVGAAVCIGGAVGSRTCLRTPAARGPRSQSIAACGKLVCAVLGVARARARNARVSLLGMRLGPVFQHLLFTPPYVTHTPLCLLLLVTVIVLTSGLW